MRELKPPVWQQSAWQDFLSSAARGQLHHGWLLIGPRGCGKAEFAQMMALQLLQTDSGQTQKLVEQQSHPDFRLITSDPESATPLIKVEAIRDLTAFFRLTPAMAKWRVAILQDANHLNRAAANALLKLLEEPPPNCVLILTTSLPGRLLPTIKSRCRRLRLSAPQPEQLQSLLQQEQPELPNALIAELTKLANFNPAIARRLLAHDGLELAQNLEQMMQAREPQRSALCLQLAERCGGKENTQQLANLFYLLREHLATTIQATMVGFSEDKHLAVALDRTFAAWEKLQQLEHQGQFAYLDGKNQALAAIQLACHN